MRTAVAHLLSRKPVDRSAQTYARAPPEYALPLVSLGMASRPGDRRNSAGRAHGAKGFALCLAACIRSVPALSRTVASGNRRSREDGRPCGTSRCGKLSTGNPRPRRKIRGSGGALRPEFEVFFHISSDLCVMTLSRDRWSRPETRYLGRSAKKRSNLTPHLIPQKRHLMKQ